VDSKPICAFAVVVSMSDFDFALSISAPKASVADADARVGGPDVHNVVAVCHYLAAR